MMTNGDDAAWAAMAAWLRDYIARAVKENRAWRDIAEELGVTHPYVMDLHSKPRAQLGPKIEQAVATKFFNGSKDDFRRVALQQFPNAIQALQPAKKRGRGKLQRFNAPSAIVDQAAQLLVEERGVKRRESVLAVAPFTFFESTEDASDVLKVTNALEIAVKGRRADPEGGTEPGHGRVDPPKR